MVSSNAPKTTMNDIFREDEIRTAGLLCACGEGRVPIYFCVTTDCKDITQPYYCQYCVGFLKKHKHSPDAMTQLKDEFMNFWDLIKQQFTDLKANSSEVYEK